MKFIARIVSLLILLSFQSVYAEQTSLTPEQEQYIANAKKIWNSLDRQQGEVNLPNGVATLKVPEDFYYLTPEHAETVLVDIWGNPPGIGLGTLGMLLPNNVSPFDESSWAVTIGYEEDGYVSDENADDIDYDELLSQMKDDANASSRERISKGYEGIELIGWASTPYYDKAEHKLYWAKEVKFGNQSNHTLNYNIRVLGRKGVLVLNFIAGMEQKNVIDSKLDTVLAIAEFDNGMRYDDFNPDIDEVAAYGIGALVAGKVVAKTGLIAAALIFLKKFGVIILIGAGALFGRIFKRSKAS